MTSTVTAVMLALRMTFLQVLQALALDQALNKPLAVLAQTAAPLFDAEKQSAAPRAAQVARRHVALQCVLFTLSILLPVWARELHVYHGSGMMNGLVKAVVPVLCLLAVQRPTPRLCAAVAIACVGFALAALPRDGKWRAPMFGAMALLFVGALSGVLLGKAQEAHGYRPTEIAVGAVVLSCVSLAVRGAGIISQQSLVAALVYGVLSFCVQRVVHQYAESVGRDALLFNLALSQGRAAAVLVRVFETKAPYWLLVGSLLALGGALVAAEESRAHRLIRRLFSREAKSA